MRSGSGCQARSHRRTSTFGADLASQHSASTLRERPSSVTATPSSVPPTHRCPFYADEGQSAPLWRSSPASLREHDVLAGRAGWQVGRGHPCSSECQRAPERAERFRAIHLRSLADTSRRPRPRFRLLASVRGRTFRDSGHARTGGSTPPTLEAAPTAVQRPVSLRLLHVPARRRRAVVHPRRCTSSVAKPAKTTRASPDHRSEPERVSPSHGRFRLSRTDIQLSLQCPLNKCIVRLRLEMMCS